MVGAYYTISEFSRLTGWSRSTVSKMIASGEIETVTRIDKGNERKLIPEEFVFYNFKMLCKDFSEKPLKDLSIREALIKIGLELHKLLDTYDDRNEYFERRFDRIFDSKGIITEQFARAVAKSINLSEVLGQQLMSMIKGEVKEAVSEAFNESVEKILKPKKSRKPTK